MEALHSRKPSEFDGVPLELVVSPSTTDEKNVNDDSDSVNDGLDIEERNKVLQKLFEEKMGNVGNQRSHSRVAVLLISWEPEREDYINADAEVDRLADVFEHRYYFKVYKKRLHTLEGKPAKHQMNLHLAQFIHDEDGHDTLLIIYYAGHGIRDIKPGSLKLIGGNPKRGNKGLNQIVWNEAEKQLEGANADLFVIFDCCYAGQLAISTRSFFSSKIFEYLGATQANDVALSPGPDSFSNALAWALEDLASHSEGFNTLQLEEKIKMAPRFNSMNQVPCLTTRGERSLRRLKIAPLSKEPTEIVQKPLSSQENDVEAVRYCLQLQFLFSRCPDETHVSDLTSHLTDLVRSQNVPLRQVLWRGLWSKDTAKIEKLDLVRLVAQKWYHHTRHSKSSSDSPKAESATTTVLQRTISPKSIPNRPREKMKLGDNLSSRQGRVDASFDLGITGKMPVRLDGYILPSGYVLADRRKWSWMLPMLSVCFALVLGRILSEFCITLALNRFQ